MKIKISLFAMAIAISVSTSTVSAQSSPAPSKTDTNFFVVLSGSNMELHWNTSVYPTNSWELKRTPALNPHSWMHYGNMGTTSNEWRLITIPTSGYPSMFLTLFRKPE